MNDEQIRAGVEGLLLGLGRPLSHTELSEMLKVSTEDLTRALASPDESRGFSVVNDGRMVELRLAGAVASIVEEVRREENDREIGKAGLEVLAAVLYRGPLTRAEIDFIRGVNSTQTLRTLTTRGLVRKVPNPKDERSFLYEATTETLAHLGVEARDELPEYGVVKSKLGELEAAYRVKENSEETSQ